MKESDLLDVQIIDYNKAINIHPLAFFPQALKFLFLKFEQSEGKEHSDVFSDFRDAEMNLLCICRACWYFPGLYINVGV